MHSRAGDAMFHFRNLAFSRKHRRQQILLLLRGRMSWNLPPLRGLGCPGLASCNDAPQESPMRLRASWLS